jgi:hypothetical protein
MTLPILLLTFPLISNTSCMDSSSFGGDSSAEILFYALSSFSHSSPSLKLPLALDMKSGGSGAAANACLLSYHHRASFEV